MLFNHNSLHFSNINLKLQFSKYPYYLLFCFHFSFCITGELHPYNIRAIFNGLFLGSVVSLSISFHLFSSIDILKSGKCVTPNLHYWQCIHIQSFGLVSPNLFTRILVRHSLDLYKLITSSILDISKFSLSINLLCSSNFIWFNSVSFTLTNISYTFLIWLTLVRICP